MRRRSAAAAVLSGLLPGLCAGYPALAVADPHVAPAAPEHPMAAMSDRDMTAMMQMDDRAAFGKVFIDQFEWRSGAAAAWQAQAWYGGDYDKVWLKTEGEHRSGTSADARVELLWDRIVAPWWSLQTGLRRDFGAGAARDWVAVGIAGVAPGWFDVEATLYAGTAGRSAARMKVDYNLLLTQRWMLQPEAESNFYGRPDPERGLGSGLANLDLALRLRYEIRREFAPYVGIVWTHEFAGTAQLARAAGLCSDDLRVAAGVRFWF